MFAYSRAICALRRIGAPVRFTPVWLFVGLAAFGLPAWAAAEGKHILIIHANNRLLPAIIEFERGLREALEGSDPATELSAEFLDYPRFSGERFRSAFVAFLREKYASRSPDVIIATGDETLDFLLRNRSEVFPSVPIVHAGADKTFVRAIGPLPADVVGVSVDYDFSGTIELALRWHPRARRLVVITGAAAQDRKWESRLRGEVSRFEDRVTVEYLSGLPTNAVLQRLGQLGDDAVVFTPGYFEDGEGRTFVPLEAARLMAAAATAPVYGPFSTFIGAGVVGGRMPSYEAMGRQAGDIVNALLAGAAPASLHTPEVVPAIVHVDWRQLQRWGIAQNEVPADAIVQFREPTLWETHPYELIAAALAFSFLSGLVVVLLVERRRRRSAETAEAKHRSDAARAMRLALAGELSGAIAHEINQPLGAILNNIVAADLMLQSGADRRDELRAVLSDIRRDNQRASEVIRRLRALFARREIEKRPFKIDDAVGDVTNILLGEAQRRRIDLKFQRNATDSVVSGDRIEIGQVLTILTVNAMDAVADMPDDRRSIAMVVDKVGDRAAISVHDRGSGIAPEYLPRLFGSFFTTKPGGLGLGLSIARTIVEAHDGRVWAENGPAEGATFHVELPIALGANISSGEAA